ncbi:MAG: DNA-binding domain-containing protein [Mangrovibacterium sp.]
MIKYFLQPNPITTDPNDQSARIMSNATLNLQDIVTLATKRGTSLTETDLTAAANLLFDVITDEVANGNNITLALVNIRPSIKGVFTSAADSSTRPVISKGELFRPGYCLVQKYRMPK